MALPILPAFAHIKRLSLAVSMRERQLIRPLNRKGLQGADYSELWAGSIEFAPMSRTNGAALAAFFEAVDGRVSPFLVTLKAGYASHALSLTGTVAAAAAGGASALALSLPAGTLIPAGTLLAIGDPHAAGYQWCEIVSEAIASASVTVDIAPRLHAAVAAGTAVSLGEIYARFQLPQDKLTGINANAAATGFSIDVIEGRA